MELTSRKAAAMPTLTPAEIAVFRLTVDDDCKDPELSNSMIQALYDKAYDRAEDNTDSEEVDNLTIVYMLRMLLAQARKKVDRVDSVGNRESRGQLFDKLERLLEIYSELAGIGTGKGLDVGAILLGTHPVEEDE